MWGARNRLVIAGLVIAAAGGLIVGSLARAEQTAGPPVRQEMPRAAVVVADEVLVPTATATPAPSPAVRAQGTTRTLSFSYDGSGRLTGVRYEGAGKSISYSYDSGGNLLQSAVLTGNAGTTPRAYLPLALNAFIPGW